MSDKLRVIRDSIGSGDDVLVVHHGRKPRPARVCEVLRSALRVRYADAPSMAHTVLLKDVRRVEEQEVVTKAPLPRASRVQLKPAAAAGVAAEPETVSASIVVATLVQPPSELDSEEMGAWLDMGKEVRERIDQELEATSAQLQALCDDVLTLNAEVERLEKAKTILQARRKRIETVLTW